MKGRTMASHTKTSSKPGKGSTGPVTLAEWRKGRGLSQREAALLLSGFLGRPVQAANIGQWETGVMPGADVAEAVRRMTRGRVTGASFGRRKPASPPPGNGS